MKKAIIWLRNDLRLLDNKALYYATQNNYHIIFIYIYDPQYQIGSAAKYFLHHALKSFSYDILQKYKAKLIIKSGNPQYILNDLILKYKIDALFYNRIYENFAIKRDSIIKNYFKLKNINVKSFNSSLLFEPSKILNKNGNYFKIFTYFWKECLANLDKIENIYNIQEDNIKILNIEDNLYSIEDLNLIPQNPNWSKKWDLIYNISELEANNILDKFIINKINSYKNDRNFPSLDNTSLLSPYLNFGLISSKQIYFKIKSILIESNPYKDNIDVFFSEIGWREFSNYLLYHFPNLDSKNFKSNFDNIKWCNNKEEIKKWQKGITGFPIIDAGMRQLYETGWMHNRVRMITASFLVKNLLVDWQIGAKWFFDCLVDANLASNSASWQWVAGSGADAAPYFRIFNPILQSQKFDPKGKYIRKWVKEIKNLPDNEIFKPIDRGNYYNEMVDLKESRKRALLAINKSVKK